MHAWKLFQVNVRLVGSRLQVIPLRRDFFDKEQVRKLVQRIHHIPISRGSMSLLAGIFL